MPETRTTRPLRRSPFSRRGALCAAALGLIALPAFTATLPVSAPSAGGLRMVAVSAPSPIIPEPATVTVSAIAAEAEDARQAAADAVAQAESVRVEIAASGLDLGANGVIDTTALEDVADVLDGRDEYPLPLLPSVVDTAQEATAQVVARTGIVATALGAAQAEAAAKAKAEAEAKAKAEAEAAAAARQSSAPTSVGAPAAAPGPVMPVGDAQNAAAALVAERGWGSDQFSCLVSLWNKESGWNAGAMNPSSGAYGIPQALPGSKMASAGADWQTNAVTQIRWGLGYIADRYGTPCGAWGHSQSVGWY